MIKCDKCFKIDLDELSLCKLLLIKPWEIASKSQVFIHFYLLIQVIHTTFADGRCTYHYIFIPTTTNLEINNNSWIRISGEFWFQQKDIQLKLDELFIMQDFDLRQWIPFGSNEIMDIFPQMIVDHTSGIWRLENNEIIEKIFYKLYDNLMMNKTMFFILDRNIFQMNSNYWRNKLRSKYVYTTNAFIPQYLDDHLLYLKKIVNNIDDIRIYKKFNNNEEHIYRYKLNHFSRNEILKAKLFDEYFRNKTSK